MAEYPKEIAEALHAIMGKCAYVQKSQKNAFHGYKYAGEADLLEVLRPAMVEHGLLLLPSGCEKPVIDEHGNTHLAVEYTLAHKSGVVWPDKLVAYGTGNDKNKTGVGDKGTYKALTGANKYLLFKLFQIETGDDPEQDSNAQNGKPVRAQEAAQILGGDVDPPKPAAEFTIKAVNKSKDKGLATTCTNSDGKDVAIFIPGNDPWIVGDSFTAGLRAMPENKGWFRAVNITAKEKANA